MGLWLVIKEPIFAKTRYTYDSYQDFWRLVELSGFKTCFVDEIDLQSENTYVTTPVNGELRPHVTHRRTLGLQRARIVWWNLERPDTPADQATRLADGGVAYHGIIDEILQYVDEVWVSDRYYQSFDPRMKYCPLGSHPYLALGHREPIEYDVAMMGAMVPRREGIAYELKKKSLRLAPNAWGVDRDKILRSTRIMMNVHQHENPAPIGEPLRIALAAAYKMALISEHLEDPHPLRAGVDFLNLKSGLAERAAELSSSWGRRGKLAEHLGNELFKNLCIDGTFRYWVMWRMT